MDWHKLDKKISIKLKKKKINTKSNMFTKIRKKTQVFLKEIKKVKKIQLISAITTRICT